MNTKRNSSAWRGRAQKSGDRKSSGQHHDWTSARINLLLIFFGSIFGVVVLRLFHLQVLEHSFYEALASGQHEIHEKLIPTRGEILAQDYHSGDLYPLATNQELSLLYAVPKQIHDAHEVAKGLAPLLHMDEDELYDRIQDKEDSYEPLLHEVHDDLKEQIIELDYAGIGFAPETVRLYPLKNSASHITGFLGYKDDERVGQYGLEGGFEDVLSGEQGYLVAEQDLRGNWITVGKRSLQEAEDGSDIVLTIDYTLQFQACSMLEEAVEKHGADEGTVIIMDPETGAIKALCNVPNYDPNNYSDVDSVHVFNNAAVSGSYESGSVFKSISLAAAIDTGKIGPNSTYVDTGSVKVAGYTIKNSDGKAYGEQTMTQVLMESLNTGTIYAVQQIGNNTFYDYVKRFGFGEQTGISLAAEASGDISSLETGKDVYAYTASYGQGLTVTPIQLVTAYGAIANQGRLMKPYIIDTVITPSGSEVSTEPQIVRQVISESTARNVSAMLVNVIDGGHAVLAAVDGYYLAGKTGTAQVPDPDGKGYSEGLHKDTFVGFGPIEDPKFVMLTKFDNPKDVQWSASSAAPLFGQIAEFLLDYYQIPPDRD